MLHRRLGDRSREALAWRGAGETYWRLERCDEAVAFHRRAVAVHRQLGDAWNHGVELDRLATAFVEQNPAEARLCWTQALSLLSSFADPRAVRKREHISRRLDELQE